MNYRLNYRLNNGGSKTAPFNKNYVLSDMIYTTSETIPGKEIIEIIGVVTGSHGDLFDDVRTYFDAMGNTPTSDNSRYTDTVDKGHGRIETRQYWVIDDIQ